MNFLKEPYMHTPSDREYGAALTLAETFCSPTIMSILDEVHEVERVHYDIVLDSDDPLDRVTLESALLLDVPNYENAKIALNRIANVIMSIGSDGENMPLIDIPQIILSSDEPPAKLEYA